MFGLLILLSAATASPEVAPDREATEQLLKKGRIFSMSEVGQGITGVATVSASSLLAATGILGGMLLGLWNMHRTGG